MTRPQPLVFQPRSTGQLGDPLDVGLNPGHHHRRRTVHRRDINGQATAVRLAAAHDGQATATRLATAVRPIAAHDGQTTIIRPSPSATEARSARTSTSAAPTASIAPPEGSACISRPRAVTSVAASASDNTPATYAAAISPIECPTSTSGATPHERNRACSATSTANNAGCAYPV